jgi:hypothetical protein
VVPLSSTALALRRAFRQAKQHAKLQYRLERARALVTTFFHEPKRFWLQYFGQDGCCAIDDVEQWTAHFKTLLGAAPGTRGDVGRANATYNELLACPDWRLSATVTDRQQVAAEALNTDFTEAEVVAAANRLHGGKSSGLETLPAEAIRNAFTRDGEGKVKGNALAPHIQRVYSRVLRTGAYPGSWAATSLAPVHKSGDKQVMGNYRGISVAGPGAKLYSTMLGARLTGYAERNGLRARTQAGCRPQHGTIQHHFVLQHILDKHRAPVAYGGLAAPLYVCFIDFAKAFDTVDRDMLWLRLEERGLHGCYLQSLRALYESVQQRVKVNGWVGPAFETASGVKQGDPMSPDLFGMLIEVFHEMLQLRCPNMGPQVGTDHVPDLIYVDDVTLLAKTPEGLQAALAVLEEFCTVFGLTVNMAKTEIVVFRPSPRSQPADHAWTYMGAPVAVGDDAKFLGLVYDSCRLRAPSAEPLAVAANRARFALQSRLASLPGLVTPELKVRLGEILIRPVASFGCQVWGVHYLSDGAAFSNCMEQVHLAYLRFVTGAHAKVSAHVLRAEACSRAYVGHWAYLIARFWNAMVRNELWLARQALEDNITLMLHGCRRCWSYRFLSFAHQIGIIPVNPDDHMGQHVDALDSARSMLLKLEFDDGMVQGCLARFEARVWHAGLGADPRTCLSAGATLCAYSYWMGRIKFEEAPVKRVRRPAGRGGHEPDDPDEPMEPKFHAHMSVPLPPAIYWSMSRFRMGGWKLQVNVQRRRTTGRLPRDQRLCPLCLARGQHYMEDELHVVFECPAFEGLRVEYRDVLGLPGSALDLHSIMQGSPTRRVATFLHRLHAAHSLATGEILGAG